MWNVWRTVLEENEKLARARLAAVEVFQQQIADEAKTLRQHKINVAKKVSGEVQHNKETWVVIQVFQLLADEAKTLHQLKIHVTKVSSEG